MAVYLLLIGVCVLNYLFGNTSGNMNKVNRKTILFFFVGMILLVWLRSPSIGTDTRNYIAMYERASLLDFSDLLRVYYAEYGYFALNMVLSSIYDDYRFLFLCIGLISIVPIMLFYMKKSENALISIGLFLLLLFSMYFSGMRQICAMAFVIPAYYATQEKKLVKFILCVAAAMLFHASAFAIALLYPMYRIKLKKSWFPFLAVMFVIIFLLRTQIFTMILSILPSRYQESYGEFTESSAVAILLMMVLFVVYTYVLTDESKLDEETIGLRNLLVLSMVLQIFASINSIAMRINYYYLLFVPVTMSKYVHLSTKRYSQIAKVAETVLSLFFMGYFIFNMYNGADALRIFPYSFSFNY